MCLVQQIPRKPLIVHVQIVIGRWHHLVSHHIWKNAWVRHGETLNEIRSFIENLTGIGRNSSRIASRRIANSRDGNNYFGNNISDDEDDADWSSDKKKKKIQSMRSNGSKKNGK